MHQSPPEEWKGRGEVLHKLRKIKSAGLDFVSFTSGEPTLHPKLAEFVSLAKDIGFKEIGIETNGIRFSDEVFAEDMVRRGMTHIGMNTPSHVEEVYEVMTRVKGSFAEFSKALDNLSRLRIRFSGNVALTDLNYTAEQFEGLVDFLRNKGLRLGHLSLRPLRLNYGEEEESAHMVRYEDMGREINKMIDFSRRENIPVCGLPVFSIPLCVCPGFEDMFADRNPWEQMPLFFTRPEGCGSCAIAHLCPGVSKFYPFGFRPRPYSKVPTKLREKSG